MVINRAIDHVIDHGILSAANVGLDGMYSRPIVSFLHGRIIPCIILVLSRHAVGNLPSYSIMEGSEGLKEFGGDNPGLA